MIKKILLAFDGSYYSEAALHYAIQLARPSGAKLVGLFLEDITAYHQFSPVFYAPEMIGLADDVIIEMKKENRQNIHDNIKMFTDTCVRSGVDFVVDREAGTPSEEIIEESQFADLIVTGSVTYFSNLSYTSDKKLVSDLLKKSHSPVVVVPEQEHDINNIIFTYDGSPSAIFSIKQFLYLFSDLAGQKDCTLLSVVEKEGDAVEGERRLLSYIHHFVKTCSHEKIIGKPVEEILHYAQIAEHSLVVMGAFGRSAFSTFFKKSTGKAIVKSNSIPVFVAHE